MSQNILNTPTNPTNLNGSNESVTLQSARNEPIYSPQQIDGALRPQLIRIDSRSTLTPRPAFLNPIRSTQARSPTNTFPFVQRPTLTPRIAPSMTNTCQPNQMNTSRFAFQRLQNLPDRPPALLQHRPDNFSGDLSSKSLIADSSETNLNLKRTFISSTEGPENNYSRMEIPPMFKKNETCTINTADGDTTQKPKNIGPIVESSVGKMEHNVGHMNVKSKINDLYTNTAQEKMPDPKYPTNNPCYATVGTDKNALIITSPTKTEVNEAKFELQKQPHSSSNVFSTEGDNDSGVDEVTEGNVKNDSVSPNRTTKNSALQSTALPKNKSFSRGDKSPSLNDRRFLSSSDATAAEKKKLPMNKIQVGSAASPNLKVVKSKIGSLQNTTYKPGGGNIKIENRKMDFSTTSSRITAKNENYTPRGGDKKIQQQKLTWNAKSKIGSLENASHKPKGGDKKIENLKLDFKDKAKSKVGSKDNIKYSPGGGDVKIENKKLEIKGQSKIGSLDNIKHKPGGGDKKIYEDRDYIRQMSAHSNVSLNDSHNSSQMDVREPASDENLNQQH